MEMTFETWIDKSRTWLAESVFPLWSTRGIDARTGAFVESLSLEGEPLPLARRGMVQGRQMYAFTEAVRLGILSQAQVQKILAPAVEYFLEHYSAGNGAFYHSVDVDGNPADRRLDLYTQAFAIFGLAAAFETLRDVRLKDRAKQVLAYLKSERSLPDGGYSELVNGRPGHEANPHMHLFEAAIAWCRADKADTDWKEFAAEINALALEKFIDKDSGALAEHFSPEWKPLREPSGFVWEPGHLFEWAWLFLQYAEATGTDAGPAPAGLYALAERQGVERQTGLALDELWSNGTVKKATARFWPQSEWIKAAVTLGVRAPAGQKAAFAQTADRSLKNLFTYFEGLKPGLWYDTRTEAGQMVNQPAKASSLYHIINAIAEYTAKRPKLS